MSALFVHDHRFLVQDGALWSRGAYNAATFEPYERVFGRVTLAARQDVLSDSDDPRALSLVFDRADRLIALPSLSNLRSLIQPDPGTVRTMREAIAAHDIVIARLPSELGLLALKTARRTGRPALVEVVGNPRDALAHHGARFAKLYAPLADWRMRRAVARADFVQYVSGQFLQRRYPSRGMTAAISDVRIKRPDPEILERRLAGMCDRRPLVFGMVAVISNRQKGVDVAIRALARARRRNPGMMLKVLGPGNQAPWRAIAVAEGVADAIEFCGPVQPGQAVLDWLDTIDVYVQASYQEGLPRALIEAMRQATPALASNAGGTFELIDKAWLHERGDAARLAEQMLALCPAAVRKEMARANFAMALSYSLDELSRRREEFWRAVLAKTGVGMQ